MILTSSAIGHEPLYQQIVDEFAQLILSGEMSAGESLPSIRVLAKERDVSTITIKRAYLELERRGLIVTRPGRSSLVAEDQRQAIEETRKALEDSVRDVIKKAELLGISDEKLATLFYRVKQATL